MAQIQPINFPLLGDATNLNVRVLPFSTNDDTCGTYYEVTTADGKRCVEGNYYLTSEQFHNWGQDNRYIDELVAASIPVTLVPLPDPVIDPVVDPIV